MNTVFLVEAERLEKEVSQEKCPSHTVSDLTSV